MSPACRLETNPMHDLLKNILSGQNQFASGGLLLMIIGGISVWLRRVPETIWYWIVRQTTMIITVTDDDAAYRLCRDAAYCRYHRLAQRRRAHAAGSFPGRRGRGGLALSGVSFVTAGGPARSHDRRPAGCRGAVRPGESRPRGPGWFAQRIHSPRS